MPAPSYKTYDEAFAAWWGRCQKLLPRFAGAWPGGIRPQDREADTWDPYGSFDAGETPEEFATMVNRGLAD